MKVSDQKRISIYAFGYIWEIKNVNDMFNAFWLHVCKWGSSESERDRIVGNKNDD